MLLSTVFAKPEKQSVYYKQIVKEIQSLGINSIGIVIIISAFMGAVITLQTAYNMENPLLPLYLIGLGCRDSMILEFSSTMIALILAGKVGSNIASELGTMRITEQIDALEIMGVNSASYLILPKIIAAVFFNPILTLISIIVGVFGGWIAVVATGVVSSEYFIIGIQYAFVPFYVTYAMVKTVFFAYSARRRRRINSSVFPENIDPQTTSSFPENRFGIELSFCLIDHILYHLSFSCVNTYGGFACLLKHYLGY